MPTNGGASSRTQSPAGPARRGSAYWAPTRWGCQQLRPIQYAFVEIPAPSGFSPSLSSPRRASSRLLREHGLAQLREGDRHRQCLRPRRRGRPPLLEKTRKRKLSSFNGGPEARPEFLETAGRISRKKPVIVLKTAIARGGQGCAFPLGIPRGRGSRLRCRIQTGWCPARPDQQRDEDAMHAWPFSAR